MNDADDATGPDKSRPAATSGDTDYTLSLDEVSDRYAKAGHPRTLRSLQRYCVNAHLDAQKIATATGDKFLVTPLSVARHIAQIEELTALDPAAAGRDTSRPVATSTAAQDNAPQAEPPTTTADDMPRQVPTEGDNAQEITATADASRYVERLKREVEQAKDERDFLREQIDRKDRTIDSLLERDRETNFLIRGLQELIPRLAMGRSEPPPRHRMPAHNRTRSNASPLLITEGRGLAALQCPDGAHRRATSKRSSRT